MNAAFRNLVTRIPVVGRSLYFAEKHIERARMRRAYGPGFLERDVGRIDASGVSFPFRSPTRAYLRESLNGFLYEPGVCAHMIERSASRATTFADIGAHFGFFSCLIASLDPRNRVHAFEPRPVAYEVLCENFAMNGIAGGAYDVALSDEIGSAPLAGASMKVQPADADTVVRVRTDTFDAWFERGGEPIDLVKIDVHGSEGKVLFGMQRALRDESFAIYLELHPDEFMAGYTLADVVGLVCDSGFELAEIREFRDARGYSLAPIGPAERARLADSRLWTPEEIESRRMFFCSKPKSAER